MIDPYKQKALAQLKKAQGMMRKVEQLINEDTYCIDVLQQSLAAVGFMKSVNKQILENHLKSCFKKGMNEPNGDNQNKLIQEVIRVIDKT